MACRQLSRLGSSFSRCLSWSNSLSGNQGSCCCFWAAYVVSVFAVLLVWSERIFQFLFTLAERGLVNLMSFRDCLKLFWVAYLPEFGVFGWDKVSLFSPVSGTPSVDHVASNSEIACLCLLVAGIKGVGPAFTFLFLKASPQDWMFQFGRICYTTVSWAGRREGEKKNLVCSPLWPKNRLWLTRDHSHWGETFALLGQSWWAGLKDEPSSVRPASLRRSLKWGV